MAQDITRPLRDPALVPLPIETVTLLRLGARNVFDSYAATFDRLAVTGDIPVIGPRVTLEIRAAADRARVFLGWTQYDLDGDGMIRRTEFDRHAGMSWGDNLGVRELALLDAEWTAADRNGDGEVGLDEIHALALEMHPVPDIGPLGPEGEAMLLMDLDNDGFVTWDEVEAVLAAPR